ncbi:MAG TPA: hypothetical protein VFG09_10025 [Thermodesulfovibrionales bacterium]|nr:hypothetical protein [Thermodesulfovibrionales bacterium]
MSCVCGSDIRGDAYPRLSFVIDESHISHFFLLLQRGVMVSARAGSSIRSFLQEEIGLSSQSVERIQSVFLDGRPVDDLDSAIIKDGSCLALSAAVPGLVGATLRRGGVYSSFRSTITYRETGSQGGSGKGYIRVKLFNLLMKDLGSAFLRRGVVVSFSELRDFLEGRSSDFWQGCKEIFFEGKPAGSNSFGDITWLAHHERVVLSVDVLRGDR